jgi:hypothetical protein
LRLTCKMMEISQFVLPSATQRIISSYLAVNNG